MRSESGFGVLALIAPLGGQRGIRVWHGRGSVGLRWDGGPGQNSSSVEGKDTRWGAELLGLIPSVSACLLNQMPGSRHCLL